MKIIAAQLRALLCLDIKKVSPLLFDLAELKGVKLECYGFSLRHIIERLGTNGLKAGFASATSRMISVYPIDAPTSRKYLFKQWLEEPVMVDDEESYTASEMVRMSAEFEGGVSYPEYLPEKL